MPFQSTWTIIWYGWRKQVVGCAEMMGWGIKWKSCDLHSDDSDLRWNAVFIQRGLIFTKLRMCKLSPLNLILCFRLGPPTVETARRQTPGRCRQAEQDREGNTSTLGGGGERRKLEMVFPQHKHSRGERREGPARHICCVGGAATSQNAFRLTFDLPCGATPHPFPFAHTRTGGPLCVRGRSADGNVYVVKVVVVSFGLRINYTCGMWASDWNEYFTAVNQNHCQSDGASGCVTWVIKDAVSHTHAAVSEVVSAVRDRSTPGVY